MAEPNKRGAHPAPLVTGGGVAISLVFFTAHIIALLAGKIESVVALALIGPMIVAAIGFCDDLRPLNVLLRSVGYVLAGSWAIYWIGFPDVPVGSAEIDLGWIGFIFGVVSLVWMQNLYNFMDGIDGLAISEAVFVCASVVLLSMGPNIDSSWDVVLLILLGSSLGFLSLNLPDAKLFMGDAGSAFLGMTLGVLVLANTSVSLWAWLILLAYFITDASLTVLVRLFRGEKIYIAHSLHAYQHLNRRIGKRETLIAIILANILWLLPLAFFANNWPEHGL
ncbi:glycosyl transferase, partial [Pseudomonadales bacterium]|nr:glycosyl transferase [Pseudomonadales bacterium]